ncbi:MAG: hypothetical protein CME62_11985 [Halobacteriovoraceae bacterium]|nr:hypothetical protein [Halobacteriovoraceae bacterium]
MKISTLILLLFLCENSLAKNQKFNPLATINSHTLEKYKFAFTRTPMGNINSNFVSSALNFGVFSRLELGTVPLFYTSPDHISKL